MWQESVVSFFYGFANPFLDTVMPVLTMMGEEYFILAVATWFLWNQPKKNSFVLILSMFTASLTTNVLKDVFKVLRPFQVMEGISGKRIHTATGYSFPSGHTQGASSLFLTLAVIFRKPAVWIISAVLTIIVAASRIYLGVHWPMDVMTSIGIALVFAFLAETLGRIFWPFPKKMRMIFRIVLGIGFVLAAYFLCMDLFFWQGRIYITDIVKLAGLTTGAFSALYVLETGSTYSPDGGLVRKILRWILGVATTAGLLALLKWFFPATDIFYFLRYALVSVWGFLVYPVLAMKAKLFDVCKQGYLCDPTVEEPARVP